jgi:hypothetical protein
MVKNAACYHLVTLKAAVGLQFFWACSFFGLQFFATAVLWILN